jgi:hypothetical protein
MENIEKTQMHKMKEIDEFRNSRFAEEMPSWKMVLFAPNLTFDLEYEKPKLFGSIVY